MRGFITQPVRLARLASTVRTAPSAVLQPAARSVPRTSPSVFGHLPRRGFTTSGPKRARYDRWDPYGGQGQPNNGRNNLTNFVKMRLGGDRGVKIYAIGIGGALIYYVYQ